MPATRFQCALDLPVNPLKRGFELPRSGSRNHYQVFPATEVLNRPTQVCVRELGLRLGTAALFYKRPGSMGIIHTDVGLRDGRWRKNVAAINWNLSGADSLMRWYAVDLPGEEPDLPPPPDAGAWYEQLNGIHFGFFGARDRQNLPKSQVRILAAAAIGPATLVRTDVPHAVENTDARTGRWALSVRFEPDFPNWKSALAALQPLVKAA